MGELTIGEALKKGVEAHKAGQLQEAVRLYKAILKTQPKHPDANHNIGVLAVGVGEPEQALPFFKTALEANPSKAQYWFSYIDNLLKLDKLEDAKAVLKQAKSKGAKGHGFDKLEQRLLGCESKQFEAGSAVSGEAQAQTSILDSLNLDQAIMLAKRKAREGAPDQAMSIYRDIQNRFPKNKRARTGLKALASKVVGKVPKVLDPPKDQLQSLIKLCSQDQYQQALEQVKTLAQKFPKSAVLLNIQGVAYNNLKKLDLSVDAYSKALALQPVFADAHYNLGNTLHAQGKLKEAIDAFIKALAIEPKHFGAYYKMGNALQKQGKPEEAIEAYKKAIAITPDHADAYNNMGVVFKEQGKLDEAIKAYSKALAIKPKTAEIYNNVGIVLKEKGILEGAIEAYSKALVIKPDYAEAYLNMSITLNKQGKLEEAIETYNKALAIKPDYAEAYHNMGNTLQEQGKLEEAMEAYNKALAIKPDNAKAVENAKNLAVQLLPIITNYGYDYDTSEAQVNSEIVLRPKYQILNAIKAYLEGDFRKVHLHNNNFKACDPKLLGGLMPKNKIFCSAYSSFIEKLLDADWDEEPASGNKIYHLGESHSLSYAHRNITIDGSNFRVAPRITFGAKAFHFSRTKNDIFKAITKVHFVSLPKRSKVLLSYGEIDCRPNEGFISAATKLDTPLEELIDHTTEGYVKWFLDKNADHRHRLYFINVPAPVYDKNLSADLNSKVARTVARFNIALEKYSLQYGFDTVDVFKFTVGKEGFSNGLFHIDNRHLGAKALPEIKQQLS